MAIKIFYCPPKFYKELGEPEGTWGNYIDNRWDIGPRVIMRINRGDWLIAADEKTISPEVYLDPNIVEIGDWQSDQLDVSDDDRNFIADKFVIAKGRINKSWKMTV